jgi:hypothetical protein
MYKNTFKKTCTHNYLFIYLFLLTIASWYTNEVINIDAQLSNTSILVNKNQNSAIKTPDIDLNPSFYTVRPDIKRKMGKQPMY